MPAISVQRSERGVTLVEVFIVVVLIVLVAMLTNVGLHILNALKREGSKTQTSRDAQVFLHNLSTEIHNAKEILIIDPDRLRFTQYDFSRGFDVAGSPANLFNPARIRTVTYSTVLTGQRRTRGPVDGAGNREPLASIQREEVSPGGNKTVTLFKGIIIAPLVGSATTYVFSRTAGVTAPPFDFVKVRLRLVPAFHQGTPLEFSIETTLRSYSG